MNKSSNLDEILNRLGKEFGTDSIMRLGDCSRQDISVIPTGNIAIDRILGIGGFPRGRVVEVYGAESSGKTTLCLMTAANCQRLGGKVAYIDVEHALDRKYMLALGIDEKSFLISQPDSGEQALRLVEALVKSGEIDMIVVDSIAALTTRAEIEGEIGDALIGQHARMMSAALRKINPHLQKSNCLLMFTNQIRMLIGMSFGNPETTPGGKAMKFYASIRVEMKKLSGAVKSGEETIGTRTKLKTVKNKLAAPFQDCEVTTIYGQGICSVTTLIEEAIEKEILVKKGSWVWYGENNLGQGLEGAKGSLLINPIFKEEIESKLK